MSTPGIALFGFQGLTHIVRSMWSLPKAWNAGVGGVYLVCGVGPSNTSREPASVMPTCLWCVAHSRLVPSTW